jgi:putative DNA primase/helicase
MPQDQLRLEIHGVRDSGGGPKCSVLAWRESGTTPLYSDRIAPGNCEDRRRYLKGLNQKMAGALTKAGLEQLDATLIELSLQATTIAGERAEVKARDRDAAAITSTQGQPLVFADPDPWPDPVDGAELLEGISALVTRHAIVPAGAADALALWIAHTYLMNAWWVSPFCTIHSPLKGCGKSTLLKIAAALVHRPLSTTNMSAAALFRVVQLAHPTLLMDEAQAWIDDTKSEFTGILQGSHYRQGATVIRVEESSGKIGVVTFDTWTPKLIALVGHLPDMMMDRSIVIRMRRKRPAETIVRLRERSWVDDMRPWRERLRRFANDHEDELAHLELDAPKGLRDRAADNWSALLAIAHVAAGEWPARAARAANGLSGGGESTEDSPGLALLADVREIFHEIAPDPSISSAQLVERLNTLEERPWADRRRGQGVSTAWVARQLGEFDVPSPVQIRPSITRKQVRGYYRHWFTEPWDRYLSVSTVSQCHNPNEIGDESAISRCHTAESVTLPKTADPSTNPGRCDAVTPSTPKQGGLPGVVPFSDPGTRDVEELEL